MIWAWGSGFSLEVVRFGFFSLGFTVGVTLLDPEAVLYGPAEGGAPFGGHHIFACTSLDKREPFAELKKERHSQRSTRINSPNCT